MPANPFPVLLTRSPDDPTSSADRPFADDYWSRPLGDRPDAPPPQAGEPRSSGAALRGALYGAWIGFLLGLLLSIAPTVSIGLGAAVGAFTGILVREAKRQGARR